MLVNRGSSVAPGDDNEDPLREQLLEENRQNICHHNKMSDN